MDIKFQQLIFTPFFSGAMQGTDSDIKWETNIQIMVKRIKAMPQRMQDESLLYLAGEIERTARKLSGTSNDLRISFKLKIEAIKKVLEEF